MDEAFQVFQPLVYAAYKLDKQSFGIVIESRTITHGNHPNLRLSVLMLNLAHAIIPSMTLVPSISVYAPSRLALRSATPSDR